MKHQIAAGALVEHEGRILLVHHFKEGAYDFWVAPGGRAQGAEDLRATARREVKEESGLEVEPGVVAYIEEFSNPQTRECKVWFTARLIGGRLDTSAPEATREYIVEAAFLAPEEFQGRLVFPPMLGREYWRDRAGGFAFPHYSGVREMEFY